jgi:hypothetical protein
MIIDTENKFWFSVQDRNEKFKNYGLFNKERSKQNVIPKICLIKCTTGGNLKLLNKMVCNYINEVTSKRNKE